MGYPISHWIVEVNAAQRFLLAHDFVRKWQALRMVNVIPHTTSRNKLDQNLGVEALLPPLWRTGQVRLPTMRDNWKTLAFIDEMTTWTRNKKQSTTLLWRTGLQSYTFLKLVRMQLHQRCGDRPGLYDTLYVNAIYRGNRPTLRTAPQKSRPRSRANASCTRPCKRRCHCSS